MFNITDSDTTLVVVALQATIDCRVKDVTMSVIGGMIGNYNKEYRAYDVLCDIDKVIDALDDWEAESDCRRVYYKII